MATERSWRIWSEHDKSDGGAVNFITAGGLFLQSLIFGYGGLRFNDNGLSLDPLLPPNVQAMKLRGLQYADAEFDISVDSAGTKVEPRARHGDPTQVTIHRAPNGVYWLTGP